MSNHITLEDSLGKKITDPTQEQIRETINKIGHEIDHCILNVGGNYIQAAGRRNELFVETDVGSGLIGADRSDYSAEDVYQMFIGFLRGDDSWKDFFTTVSFSDSSDFSRSQEAPEQEKKPKFDVKEEAGKALKAEGRYVARRQTRRGISRILSMLTGLFIRNKLRK